MRLPLVALMALASSPIVAASKIETPAARAHHALVYDEMRQQVLLSGGSTPKDGGSRFEVFDDLWTFDGQHWQRLNATSEALSSHRLTFDSQNKVVVSVGGFDGKAVASHRVLHTDAFINVSSKTLPAAAEPGLTFERKRGQLLMFGGSGADGLLGDTWIFRNAAWQKLDIPGPPARQAAMLLYQPSRGATFLFGGMGAGRPPTALGDFWQFDGAQWTELKRSLLPSARHSSGIAYDSLRKRIVLFGGLGGDGFLNDTWSFDGEQWTKLSDQGPSPRAMGYLAYDAKRDRILLFGGRTGWPDGDMGDTWEFDGQVWREVANESAEASAQDS